MDNERLEKLHELLQELIGLHRDLQEQVRNEALAIANADISALQECALTKEALVHWIRRTESFRNAIVQDIAAKLELQNQNPTLRTLIAVTQVREPEIAKKLETDLHTLVVLVERIKQQNESNAVILEQSIQHVQKMKENILGETTSTKTYNPQGQKTGNKQAPVSRMISKEA